MLVTGSAKSPVRSSLGAPDIRMGLWNPRSVANKPSIIQSLITAKGLDVVCVTETWLTPSFSSHEVVSSNFEIFRRDRGSCGGGILVAVSKKLLAREIIISSAVELLAVEVFSRPKLTIACIYIPPACSESYVIASVNTLDFTSDVMVCGDFNCPDINWKTLSATTPISTKLCDLAYSSNLVQMVSFPTHILGNCLDLILVNCPNRVFDVTGDTTSFMSASDHFAVSVTIKSGYCNFELPCATRGFNFFSADYLAVENFLLDYDMEFT